MTWPGVGAQRTTPAPKRRRLIAVDGKTLRGVRPRRTGQPCTCWPPSTHARGMVLGQVARGRQNERVCMTWRPPRSDEMPRRLAGRGRRRRYWSAESPQQVWCRTRGTWDCRCEHEPQIRLTSRSSPVGRLGNPARRRHGTDPRPGRWPGCAPGRGRGVRAHAGAARRRADGQGAVQHHHRRAGRAGRLAGRSARSRLAAMEATGVYWKPVYYALEGRFELWLCNAHHVKNVPGRKTDMSDASGWPTWPRTAWCGPASCRRRRSASCGS